MEKRRKNYYKRSADYVPVIYKQTDLAYMAGIVDGEGCFFIGVKQKLPNDGYVNIHYTGLLKVCNTDASLIDWLKNTFDGTCSTCSRITSKKTFYRDIYDWVATGDRLLDLCEQILPFLVIKKKHCEIMIRFRKSYTERLGSHKISEESLVIRQQCYEEIRHLNSRFHLHPMKQ